MHLNSRLPRLDRCCFRRVVALVFSEYIPATPPARNTYVESIYPSPLLPKPMLGTHKLVNTPAMRQHMPQK